MKKVELSLSRTAGFTILELMAVLAILALAAVFAMPAADRTRRATPLRMAALDMASMLKTARAEALRSNQEQLFTIDLTNRTFGTSAMARSRPLNRQLTVAYEVPVTEQSSEGVASIRFRPDGSSSGGLISISGARQSAMLHVDWMTGSTRISWRR
jgi:general secretion pathway protein H